MKSTTKKITLAGLGAACALTLSLGVGLLANSNSGFAYAEDGNSENIAAAYFYDNLVDSKGNEYTLAKKFYEALESMNESDDFVDGIVDYSLDDIVTSDQLKAWIENNDLTVPKAFGAARDAFLTDHPELFYVNFYKLTISVAMSGKNYVGFINSGREANIYYENGLNTQSAVSGAITAFNNRVDEIVGIMNKKETDEKYSERDVFLAKEVSKYLAENITYDYVAYDNKDDPNYIAAAYINTAYGGLVEGKAVCGGFSTAYKVIMDKLGVPCIAVNGYSNNKDENGYNAASNVYHQWNYVWLKAPSSTGAKTYAARATANGAWYSVDVTWNHSAANKYRYAVLNAASDAAQHVTDGEISSSGYKLTYPNLSLFNYGSTGETDGLQYAITYNREEENLKDDSGEPLQCNYKTVSYNGKSAQRLLEEDGLYIVYRDAVYGQGNKFSSFSDNLRWMQWSSLAVFIDNMTGGIKDEEFYIQDNDIETKFYDNTSVYATQFAVFDVAPDGKFKAPGGQIIEGVPYYYSDDLVDDIKAIEMGELLINQTYGTYTPPPYIQQSQASTLLISDSMRGPDGFIAESKAFVFEVTYDEPLHVLDPSKKIGIEFSSEHPDTKEHAKFYPVNKDEDGNPVYVELIQKPRNSGDPTLVYNTLRFKFAPSLMYAHNMEGYHFAFSNVGSEKMVHRQNSAGGLDYVTSDKVPNPAYYCFARTTGVCPARFNYDGRLYIECCAQPTLITQSDLSEDNFKDENGNSTFSANERSQMVLVAEKANTETVDAIFDGMSENADINVSKDDVKASETYDISLQICKKYPTIPDGSYVKMALGFPEGYGPNDKGVTFKIFHRKHVQGDEYIIEEIPCVVTQFGIVATVTSFSPYMVAAVDASKATDKTIYASIEGKGGTLTMEDGKIQSLNESNKSYTYTIKPDAGYQIYSVNLNGKNVADRIKDGKLTVNYDELSSNNELVIQYIADEAAARIQKKLNDKVIDQQLDAGVKVIDTKGNVAASVSMPSQNVNPDNFVKVDTNSPAKKNVAAIAIPIAVCVVIVAAVAISLAVVISKKKN